jgi:hypothetical protein
MIAPATSIIFLVVMALIGSVIFLYPERLFTVLVYGSIKPPKIVVPFFRVLSAVIIAGSLYGLAALFMGW